MGTSVSPAQALKILLCLLVSGYAFAKGRKLKKQVLLPAVNTAFSPLWLKISCTSNGSTNKARREKIFFSRVYFVLFTARSAVSVTVSPLLSGNFPSCPRGPFPQQRREKQVPKVGKHYCETKERGSLPVLWAGGRP